MAALPIEQVDPALVDVTLANILASRMEAADHNLPTLSGDDVEALDAYMNAGRQVSRVATSLRQRANVVDAMAGLVSRTPVPHADATHLIDRTMQAVLDERTFSPIPIERGRIGTSFRLADVASIAAVLVLGVSALLPVLSSWSTRREKTNCVANLGGIAGALGEYSNDYAGSMPVASASIAGDRWWDVGQDPSRSNSANLFTLRKQGYAPLDEFACAGNPHAVRALPQDASDWQNLDQVSYSYYVMFSNQRPGWRPVGPIRSAEGFLQPSTTVVLSDASPVIRRALRGEPIFIGENSPNHAGSGQWAVHADGSAAWMQSPMNGHDNIWLPANLEEAIRDIVGQINEGQDIGAVDYLTREAAAAKRAVRFEGNEAPGSAEDSFVGP